MTNFFSFSRILTSVDRQTLKIAFPLILSNITIPLVGFTDNTVMGHFGSAIYIGAIGIGSIIISYILFSFGFIKSVTTGLTSQHDGRKDYESLIKNLYQIFLIAIIISSLIIIFRNPIIHYSLHLFNGSQEVKSNSEIYLSYRVWSIPAIFLRDILIGYYIGVRKIKIAMMISIFVNLLNIFLDYYLVIIQGYKIEGVAIASLIAEYSIIIFIINILKNEKIFLNTKLSVSSIVNWPSLKRKISINFDFFIRSLILMTCFAYFMNIGARYGDVVLAANAILLNFFFIFSFGIDGFAHAAETLIGNSYGKKDIKSLKASLFSTGKFSFILMIIFLIFFLLFEKAIVLFITDIALVQTTVFDFSIWLYLIFFLSTSAFWLDGVFIGLMKSKLMRNIMIFSGLIFFSFVFYLGDYNNLGLWISFLIFFFTRSILLTFNIIQYIKKSSI